MGRRRDHLHQRLPSELEDLVGGTHDRARGGAWQRSPHEGCQRLPWLVAAVVAAVAAVAAAVAVAARFCRTPSIGGDGDACARKRHVAQGRRPHALDHVRRESATDAHRACRAPSAAAAAAAVAELAVGALPERIELAPLAEREGVRAPTRDGR